MIYLASPYTASTPELMQARYEAAAKETARLLRAGLIVYSPIVHCHYLAREHSFPPDFGFWQDYNFGMLTAARDLWVFTTMGWAESRGVQAEINYARQLGKRVVLGEYDGTNYQYR